MLALFPEGFEERDLVDGLELAAYTDWRGEERLWHVFGGGRSDEVEPDWLERWRTFHRPVRVGRLWIGPPWIDPPADAVPVVIEPGRAFGTGAHATTRLCIELLADQERGSLLDVGCGSGVIAVAAAKLGFGPVVAVDVDPAAVETTRANALQNAVSIDTQLLDARTAELPPADLAVVNIELSAAAVVSEHLRCERLVTSGYLLAEEPDLRRFRHVKRRATEGWAADLFLRQ